MRHESILLSRPAPRAIAGVVRANADPSAIIAQIQSAVVEMKTDHAGRLTAIEAMVDQQAAANAGLMLSSAARSSRPEDPEYTELFASYFRKGGSENELIAANGAGNRAQINAAMSVGTNDQGGYLAPTEWDRQISQALVFKSPMRRLATVQTTTVGAYSTIWNNAQWGSGWVGEVAARPQTTNATLSPITFGHGEIYAMPAITQRLLDDAQFNVEAWLVSQVETEFSRQEGIAFLSGDGANKPFGLLQYITGGAAATQHPAGVLGVSTVVGTTAITTDELVTFAYSLTSPYRSNSTWLMNSATAAYISKMKDGQGNYIWRESFIIGQPATLLGRPVELDENMPNIATGNYPIAFGDFKTGYLINDRMGSRILRDPFSSKPYILYYTTKRVGAGVADPNAIRLLKMA